MEEQAKYNKNTTMGEMEEYKSACNVLNNLSEKTETELLRVFDKVKARDYTDVILCELSKPKKQESVLQEAQRILHGDRDADYGDPVENFKNISKIAKFLGVEISPADCCKVMLAVKIAREGYKSKRDNLVDFAAYADILNQIIEKDEE